MKKLLLGVCCLLFMGSIWAMKEEEVFIKEEKREVGKSEEKKQEQKKKDILEEMGVAKDAKFFIQFKGNKIEVSRAGVMRCSLLLDLVGTAVNNDETKKFVLPWGLEKIGTNDSFEIKESILKAFVAVVEIPVIKGIKSLSLLVFINLANYVQSVSLPQGYKPDRDILQELVEELKARFKKLTDKDYLTYLQGAGFLWEVVHFVPEEVLEDAHCVDVIREADWFIGERLKAILPDGRLIVKPRGNYEWYTEVWSIGKTHADWLVEGEIPAVLSDGRLVVANNKHIEIWSQGKKKADWLVKGEFQAELPDGRLVITVERDDTYWTEIWSIGKKKADKLVKGLFKAELPDGRLVIMVERDKTYWREIWSIGKKKADWLVKGLFRVELPDGRLVVEVKRDGTYWTEIWSIGKKRADWLVKGDFEAVLSDGRLVITVERDGTYWTEIWSIGKEKADKLVKGLFKAELPDGRLVVIIRQWTALWDPECRTLIWNINKEKLDWLVKGEFKAVLSDGRLIVKVDHDDVDTEIWSIDKQRADYGVTGDFEAILPDGRLLVGVRRRYEPYMEVWSLTGRSFVQQVMLNVLHRIKPFKIREVAQQSVKYDKIRITAQQLLDSLEKDIQNTEYLKNETVIEERLYFIEMVLKQLDLNSQEWEKDSLVKRWRELVLTLIAVQERQEREKKNEKLYKELLQKNEKPDMIDYLD